ncbi:hypothetical protein [Marinobacter daqiaonensis]|uniref:hypothetical protein n=1 Tax=Marinobacter daqiaonensis TaxID=650891 RepID=UPI000B83E1BF|nr:hypothetical protein [Marinobacter daqiaonensis]
MKQRITKDQIDAAKQRTKYGGIEKVHEHDDCVRIAYEWLDAQKKNKRSSSKGHMVKHLIEDWAGRYVSTADVMVAAELHPDIHGEYPGFNLSANLTEPSEQRLMFIEEAYQHKDKRGSHDPRKYKNREMPVR